MHSSIALLSAFVALVSSQSLSDAISEQPDLSDLAQYLQSAGLLDTVAGLDEITIFAPTNQAFEDALDAYPNLVNTNNDDGNAVSDRLANILQYHVVPGAAYLSTDLLEYPGNFVSTALDGQTVNPFYGDSGSGVYSAEKRLSAITQTDIEYDNGVIHVIDKVMLPPTDADTAALDMGFLYFAGAVAQLDLTDDINGADQVTLFIPTDQAFVDVGSALADLSTDDLDTLIKYHVVVSNVATTLDISDGSNFETLSGDSLDFTVDESDGALYVNNARVITPNILLANGVAHLVDQVLNPNSDYEFTVGDGTGVPAFEDVESAEVPALTSGLPSPTNAYEPTATFSAVSAASGFKSQVAFAALFAIAAAVAFAM